MLALLTTLAFAAAAPQVSPPAAAQDPAAIRCETGPVLRRYGGTNWIVYSCQDGASMVVLAYEGNPAAPFAFFLSPKDGGYAVEGEGTGDRKASDAAGAELSRLSPAELAELLAATRAAPAGSH